jgi:ubiquinol oxidase
MQFLVILIVCSVVLLFSKVDAFRSVNHRRNIRSNKRLLVARPELEFAEGETETVPRFIQQTNKMTVGAVKDLLTLVYGKRHYARFAALETIARVPYFSYTSVLHLYETLGLFRQKEYIKLHFAESWNELHHLLIMEELGGSERFSDRWVAQHVAVFYYWLVIVIYMVNPAIAYDLNKHVETHAFQTYRQFLETHEEELKSQPAPQVAIDYYMKDCFLFDACNNSAFDEALKVSRGEAPTVPPVVPDYRRPEIKTLYDVFYNVMLDEADHAQTMCKLSRDVGARMQQGPVHGKSQSQPQPPQTPE